MSTRRGQGRQPAFEARTLNHVALEVQDLDRSVAFYQTLFGMPIRSSQVIGPRRVTAPGLMIGEGPQFLIFMEPTAFVPAERLAEADVTDRRRINHFCLGIASFDPDGVVQTLEARDLRAVRNLREGMRNDQIAEIGTIDPDRMFVQIQDQSYCGGSGTFGQLCDAGVEYSER